MANHRRPKTFWQRLKNLYEESDLTQRAFAEKHGVNYCSFKNRLYELRREEKEQQGEQNTFVEIKATPVSPESFPLRLYLSDEVFFDFERLPPADYLATLAQSLLE